MKILRETHLKQLLYNRGFDNIQLQKNCICFLNILAIIDKVQDFVKI